MDQNRIWELFLTLHQGLPRQGPGCEESTDHAFRLCTHLPELPRILDVGCGPGAQTLHLAERSNGPIVALDLYQEYLDQLTDSARSAGFAHRITAVCGDMRNMSFEPSSFDLIWSEGAIYIMGFDKALKAFKLFLKPGGYIAFTELTWLTDCPTQEVCRFWDKHYPGMRSVKENLNSLFLHGYQLVGDFPIPARCWNDEYYSHLRAKMPDFEKQYGHEPEARAVLDIENAEIELFREFGGSYGYVFYVARLPE